MCQLELFSMMVQLPLNQAVFEAKGGVSITLELRDRIKIAETTNFLRLTSQNRSASETKAVNRRFSNYLALWLSRSRISVPGGVPAPIHSKSNPVPFSKPSASAYTQPR